MAVVWCLQLRYRLWVHAAVILYYVFTSESTCFYSQRKSTKAQFIVQEEISHFARYIVILGLVSNTLFINYTFSVPGSFPYARVISGNKTIFLSINHQTALVRRRIHRTMHLGFRLGLPSTAAVLGLLYTTTSSMTSYIASSFVFLSSVVIARDAGGLRDWRSVHLPVSTRQDCASSQRLVLSYEPEVAGEPRD